MPSALCDALPLEIWVLGIPGEATPGEGVLDGVDTVEGGGSAVRIPGGAGGDSEDGGDCDIGVGFDDGGGESDGGGVAPKLGGGTFAGGEGELSWDLGGGGVGELFRCWGGGGELSGDFVEGGGGAFFGGLGEGGGGLPGDLDDGGGGGLVFGGGGELGEAVGAGDESADGSVDLFGGCEVGVGLEACAGGLECGGAGGLECGGAGGLECGGAGGLTDGDVVLAEGDGGGDDSGDEAAMAGVDEDVEYGFTLMEEGIVGAERRDNNYMCTRRWRVSEEANGEYGKGDRCLTSLLIYFHHFYPNIDKSFRISIPYA
ncbi:hypothetical protein Salat_1945900 [Sesamum alatum]|uniref:Uncharacterized protein n=1 Tax=Sesamum alatum TaxID=300844 RepID=A0AAE1Y4X3_9LAMI|nr:hypothetical protein Salat_1945900 [Sesamum alatum]